MEYSHFKSEGGMRIFLLRLKPTMSFNEVLELSIQRIPVTGSQGFIGYDLSVVTHDDILRYNWNENSPIDQIIF